MFRSISGRFSLLVTLLALVFVFGYAQVAYFLGSIDQSSERRQEAANITAQVSRLQRSFWELRFWEKAILDRTNPVAESEFGRALAEAREAVTFLDGYDAGAEFKDSIARVEGLLQMYEGAFTELIQLKTEQQLNKTDFATNYQVLSSTILLENNADMLKPLFNIVRFQEDYFINRAESKFRALGVVFESLQRRIKAQDMAAGRFESYLGTYRTLLAKDWKLERTIRDINSRFDEITGDLTAQLQAIALGSAERSTAERRSEKNLLASLRRTHFLSSAVGAFILAIVILQMARKVVSPIRELSKVVDDVRSGNRDARYSVIADDEIGRLGLAFNELVLEVNRQHRELLDYQGELEKKVAALAASEDELKKHRLHLSELVEERTAELVRAVNNLKQEIERRRTVEQELVEARVRAESANQAKSDFLANMSHEIRTPMNAVIGMGQLLVSSELSEQQRENVDMIMAAADNLLVIINDILDFSKIEAGQLTVSLEPMNLPDFLRDVSDFMNVSALGKGLDLSLEIDERVPVRVMCDRGRLRQILINLLGNAVKFTDHGRVVLRVSRLESAAEDSTVPVRFEVEDSGIGIPADKLETIFEPFSQAESSLSRSFEGTGLGLSINSRLVEMLGGEKLQVRSEQGEGSTFFFTLFMREAAEEAKDSPQTPALTEKERGTSSEFPQFPDLRVLVAEDNAMNQMLLRKVFGNFGLRHVEFVLNGKLALEFILSDQAAVDVVLMDVQMPVMDGLTATRKLRQAGCTVPIVALTAHAMKEDRDRCFEAGMNEYLAKPYKLDALERIFRQVEEGGLT